MKIGAENKKKVIAMAALLAIALPLSVYSFRGMFGGGSAGAPASSRAATPQPGKTGLSASLQDPSQDPRLRTDILEASRKIKYEPGRDIFHMKALPTPTPIAAVRPPTPTPPLGPTPTPPPPPIPLKYYGFASKAGEPKKVFLADQDQRVFVAGQGEIVDRRYRLIQIQPSSVIMEDVLTNNRQPIPLTSPH